MIESTIVVISTSHPSLGHNDKLLAIIVKHDISSSMHGLPFTLEQVQQLLALIPSNKNALNALANLAGTISYFLSHSQYHNS